VPRWNYHITKTSAPGFREAVMNLSVDLGVGNIHQMSMKKKDSAIR
jgi:hypothetical protein